MADLSPTEKAVRVLVAQHLPGVPADLVAAYAEHIHPATQFGQLGLADVDHPALIVAVEQLFGVQITDDEAEACKSVRALSALVDARGQAVAA